MCLIIYRCFLGTPAWPSSGFSSEYTWGPSVYGTGVCILVPTSGSPGFVAGFFSNSWLLMGHHGSSPFDGGANSSFILHTHSYLEREEAERA